MKTLIMCATCQQYGSKQTLAEVLPSGMLAVQRLHHGSYGKDYTVISGNDFQLLCGQCGQTVFVKQERRIDESINFGLSRIYRISLMHGTLEERLGGTSHHAGTALSA